MPSFDEKKAYAGKTETFFDDGREIELLHYIYSKPDLEEIRDSPSRVLQAIDEYARTKKSVSYTHLTLPTIYSV